MVFLLRKFHGKFIPEIFNRTFIKIIRTYALGFDRKIKELRKPIGGYTNPEWRSNERESPEMHEQQFCQLSHINVSSMLMLGSIPVFAR